MLWGEQTSHPEIKMHTIYRWEEGVATLENPIDRGAWQAAAIGLQSVGHN